MTSKFSQAWERISLRTKLTALSVAIIGVLVLVSSLGTIALLRTYLQANVDGQLTSTAATLSHLEFFIEVCAGNQGNSF